MQELPYSSECMGRAMAPRPRAQKLNAGSTPLWEACNMQQPAASAAGGRRRLPVVVPLALSQQAGWQAQPNHQLAAEAAPAAV